MGTTQEETYFWLSEPKIMLEAGSNPTSKSPDDCNPWVWNPFSSPNAIIIRNKHCEYFKIIICELVYKLQIQKWNSVTMLEIKR